MSIELVTVLMFGSIFLFLMLGLPVCFAIGGVALIFSFLLWGWPSGALAATRAMALVRTTTLVAIPLFICMAAILERSGIAEDLYGAMYKWIGIKAGGLAVGTVIICTLMAAMSGITATATVAMGIIALPAMLKRGYDKRLVMGSIMAGGSLGPLIPPSLIMVVYGTLTQTSIAKLFAGGILPGLMLSFIFSLYILIKCHLNPSVGPPLPPDEKAEWKSKFSALRRVILPVILIIVVLGSIFSGLATPTEAAAIGAFGALICAAVNRKFNWALVKYVATTTAKTSGMIVWVVFGAGLFANLFIGLGGKELVAGVLEMTQLGKWGALILVHAIWLGLGCMMEALSILMITYPIIVPLLDMFAYDPVWYAILFVVNTNMGYQTPPFGTNLFYMKGVAPEGTEMADIYRSAAPFVLLQVIGLGILALFPSISSWLPSVMF